MSGYSDLWKRTNAELLGLRSGILQVYKQLTSGTTTVDGTVAVSSDGKATVTIGGVTYALTLVADASGDTINPATTEDLLATVTTTNELLFEIRELLKSIAEV